MMFLWSWITVSDDSEIPALVFSMQMRKYNMFEQLDSQLQLTCSTIKCVSIIFVCLNSWLTDSSP